MNKRIKILGIILIIICAIGTTYKYLQNKKNKKTPSTRQISQFKNHYQKIDKINYYLSTPEINVNYDRFK